MGQIIDTDLRVPPPLDFFENDYIHPDNLEIIKTEEKRWRLLGFFERIRLQWYVESLRRELRRGRYNQHILKLDKLRRAVRRAKRAYRAAPPEQRPAIKAEILSIIDQARPEAKALHELKETYEAYSHYRGWLEYEADNRKELRDQARREKRNRRKMEKEADWIESLLIDVWRKHPHCHYIRKDSKTGKERAVVPRFDRSLIKPQSHEFYLKVSARTLFGWRNALPYGVDVAALISKDVLLNMQAATKRQVDAYVNEQNHVIIRVARLDSPDALPKSFMWREAVRHFPDEDKLKYPWPVGVNESRHVVWFDFAGSNHLLVAGTSGSGKSNVVNAIVATLASTYSPDELRFMMIDMKGGVEFGHWHDLPHVLGDVVRSLDGVVPLLEQLINISEKRFSLMSKAGVKKIADYNRRVDAVDQLPRIFLLMDEMNSFIGLKDTQTIHNLITSAASKGRACGVHIIGATQHPDRDTIPGRIKTNMDVRMCGFMPSEVASRIVLDGPEASQIVKLPGRFVARRGMDTRVVQVPLVTDDDIAGVVSSCLRAYPETRDHLRELGDAPEIRIWNEQRMIEECLALIGGHLGAQKLHRLLGDEESPGERSLQKLVNSIIDRAERTGYVVRESDGSQWKLRKGAGGARILVPLSGVSGVSDKKKRPPKRSTASEKPSDLSEVVELPAAGD